MTEVDSLPDTPTTESGDPSAIRRIRPRRGLPGGRAVVGALLVTIAAVSVFAAHLEATAEPSSHYLLATDAITPGTLIVDQASARALFSSTPVDLQPPVDARVVAEDELDELIGQVVLVSLQPGDLLHRTALVDVDGFDGGQVMSFPVERSGAVDGALVPGERIDVLATRTVAGESSTAFIARSIRLVEVSDGTGSRGGQLVLTVEARKPEEAQALGHAANTASVFVTRSAIDPGPSTPLPGSYRPGGGQDADQPTSSPARAPR